MSGSECVMSGSDKVTYLKQLRSEAEFTRKMIDNWLIEKELINFYTFGSDSKQYHEHEIDMHKVLVEIKSRYDDVFSKLLENTNRSLNSLNLPAGCLNPLLAANVVTVGDVFRVGRKKLLVIRNFGPKKLEVLERTLQEHGYTVPWLDE